MFVLFGWSVDCGGERWKVDLKRKYIFGFIWVGVPTGRGFSFFHNIDLSYKVKFIINIKKKIEGKKASSFSVIFSSRLLLSWRLASEAYFVRTISRKKSRGKKSLMKQ